ncbi:hypothetical protein Tco_0232855 [Tanacetum coccineum]
MLQMRLQMFKGLFELRLQAILQRVNAITWRWKRTLSMEFPKPRVRDSKYFMEQMLLAKQDEAGVILTDEQNDFLFADASRMEEIEELSANICLMARIQPADQNSDDEPSYESAFIIPLMMIKLNTNIQFDSVKGNVNKWQCRKKDNTHVYDMCALETLARNAYDEAAKQQRFAQKVQEQNMTLTSQIEMYKERNRNLFQRDIKEMKDVFEQNDVYLDEIERQNDLLKDQLLEASLKHDIELWCVKIRIIQKLEDENVSLNFKVQSLIKERDNAKMEYKKLFDSIKKTRSQTQKEMDELIAHVSEKTYAYGAIRAENQNLLHTISELKARMKNGENRKGYHTKRQKTIAKINDKTSHGMENCKRTRPKQSQRSDQSSQSQLNKSTVKIGAVIEEYYWLQSQPI